MSKYKIFDWVGNEIKQKVNGLWVDLEFTSFDDAWEYLYLRDDITEEDYQEYDVKDTGYHKSIAGK